MADDEPTPVDDNRAGQLSRRTVLVVGGIAAASAALLTAGSVRAVTRELPTGDALANFTAFNVKDYGATGNGITDDYAAIKSAVAAINTAGRGRLMFPPGVYKIDQYKITGGAEVNSVTDIIFQNCNGLSVIGYGAVINVKGDFNRPADVQVGEFWYSYSESVVPFSFVNCRRFEVCGFELNGNVNLMTRAAGVAEDNYCSGIVTNTCSQYSLRDLYVHHFACDGILLGLGFSSTTADKQVMAHNVRSLHNARQGLSVIQVLGATFIGCEFSETGNTGGTYGSHAPVAGVDIEPELNTPTVDVRTGLITFMECKFRNNGGSQFAAGHADRTQHIRLRDCELIAGTSTSEYPMILAVADGIIENSVIDTGGKYVYPAWASPFDPAQRTMIRHCEIRSPDKMLAVDINMPITIDGCRFVCTATGPRANPYAIYIQNTGCVFTGNHVFIPAAAYNGSGSGNTHDVVLLMQSVRLSRDNFFETDLSPTVSQHFATSYTNTKSVQNETYLSAGSAKNGFRPNINSTWDNTFPYSTD